MRGDQYKTLKQIISCTCGAELKEKKGGHFRFPIYLTDAMFSAGIDNLDLNVRAYNCLRRAGYTSIGNLAEGIAYGAGLKNIRGCGADTIAEIMEKLFLYQLGILPAERKGAFLQHMVQMNDPSQEVR